MIEIPSDLDYIDADGILRDHILKIQFRHWVVLSTERTPDPLFHQFDYLQQIVLVVSCWKSLPKNKSYMYKDLSLRLAF